MVSLTAFQLTLDLLTSKPIVVAANLMNHPGYLDWGEVEWLNQKCRERLQKAVTTEGAEEVVAEDFSRGIALFDNHLRPHRYWRSGCQENTDAFAAGTCDVLRHATGAADQVPLRARE